MPSRDPGWVSRRSNRLFGLPFQSVRRSLRSAIRLWGFPLLALAIPIGCAPAPAPAPVSANDSPDVAACEAGGGRVQGVCLMNVLVCVTAYADAGQACSDSSECGGRCMDHGEAPEPGRAVAGTCQRDDNPCGCVYEVLDGVTQSGVCID